MLITTSELETKLIAKTAGTYLFFGEEEYLKMHYLNRFREVFAPDSDLAAFNHTVIDKGDLSALENSLSSLPVLDLFGADDGGRKLIELRDTNFDKLPKADLDALCDMIKENSDNVLIIYTIPSEFSEGTKKKPSSAYKALTELCFSVRFERQSPQKLVSWLGRHFTSNRILAESDTLRYMIDYCSSDMFILASETDKLCAYAKAHDLERIGVREINEVCSRSKVFGAFDFANAILDNNVPLALSVLSDMKRKKEKPEEIMAQLSGTYCEMLLLRQLEDGGMNKSEMAKTLKKNEYALQIRLRAASKYTLKQLEDAVERCLEADRAIKSQPINKYLIIEELILKGAQGF